LLKVWKSKVSLGRDVRRFWYLFAGPADDVDVYLWSVMLAALVFGEVGCWARWWLSFERSYRNLQYDSDLLEVYGGIR
jgi:hypothetical protein